MSTPFQPNTEGVFYDVPAEVYHKAPGVSQSTLKAFDDAGSPKHFKTMPRKPSSPDMQFGTLVHAAVLEPKTFDSLFYVRPDTYGPEKKPWHNGAAACKTWNDQHEDRSIILDSATYARIVACATAAKERAGLFSKALNSKNARREVSFFKRDAETGLLLKARADLLAVTAGDEKIIFDLKKVETGCGNEKEFQKQVLEYGYYSQAAAYLEITGAAEMYFVPFDDDAPFDCNIWSLHPEWLQLGRLEYRRMLRAYAQCVKTDTWPGYPQDGRELPLRDWLRKRITELNAAETMEF